MTTPTRTEQEREKFDLYWQTEGSRQQCDSHEERAWRTWEHLIPQMNPRPLVAMDYDA